VSQASRPCSRPFWRHVRRKAAGCAVDAVRHRGPMATRQLSKSLSIAQDSPKKRPCDTTPARPRLRCPYPSLALRRLAPSLPTRSRQGHRPLPMQSRPPQSPASLHAPSLRQPRDGPPVPGFAFGSGLGSPCRRIATSFIPCWCTVRVVHRHSREGRLPPPAGGTTLAQALPVRHEHVGAVCCGAHSSRCFYPGAATRRRKRALRVEGR